MPTTVYDVAIRYELEDHASHGLEGIGKHAETAGRHTMDLKEALVGLGEVFLVGEAFHKGKELFIDWNREIQNMRIQGAAMLEASDLAKTWDKATISASKMVDEFNRFAVTSPVTTRELEGFANGVNIYVAQAGGGIKDIVNVTEQGIIAAKAFGMESSMAALQIGEAISRGAHIRERFTSLLIKSQNMTLAQFNALDPTKRLAVIEQALNSPAMRDAAKAFGDSWDGVFSTLKDNVEITFGHAGHEMFMAIASEVKGINTWLKENDQKVEHWGAVLGRHLKEGFDAVKAGVGFLVAHKDTLLKIGEVWAASKILGGMGAFSGGGIAGGMAGMGSFLGGSSKMGWFGTPGQSGSLSFGNVLGGAASSVFLAKALGADKLQSTVTGLTGALSTLPGPIGLVGSALNGLVLGIEALDSYIDGLHKEQVDKTAEQNVIMDNLKKTQDSFLVGMALNGQNAMTREAGRSEADALLGNIIQEVREAGAYTKDARLDTGKLVTYLNSLNIQGEAQSQYLKVAADAFKYFGGGEGGAATEEIYRRLGIRYTDFDSESEKRKAAKKANVNVTIQRIEVASEDPDRFAMGLSRSFRKLNQNPTAAVDALHGSL